MSAIWTEGLTKTYGARRGRPEIRAVDQLSLEVSVGRAFAFLGPNGAGKTTTVYMLLGLRRPTSGRGRILGEPLGSIKAKAKIGFLPEAMNPKGYYTTQQMLGYCTRLHGTPESAAAERTDYVLSALGLQEVRHQRTSRLSKGMIQRLGLAQALVSDPDLLILDEPTSNLDPVGRRDVMNLLRELKGQGKTIFISSHVLSEVEAVWDDVAIISRGRLVKEGSLSELAGESGGYEVTTEALDENARQGIAVLGGHAETKPDRRTVIRVPDQETQQRVVATLVKAGRPVLSTRRLGSTLEDIFFRALGEER